MGEQTSKRGIARECGVKGAKGGKCFTKEMLSRGHVVVS